MAMQNWFVQTRRVDDGQWGATDLADRRAAARADEDVNVLREST